METIIYSDILNQTEFLRTLAKHGHPSFGMRVMSLFDLCHLALIKSGIKIDKSYLSEKEQDYVYNVLNNYSSFDDGKNMKNSINTFRDTGKGNDEEALKRYLNAVYDKKLYAITDAFRKYNQYKKDNNLYDLYDLVYLLDKEGKQSNINLIYYSDLPYSPYVISVLKKLFIVKEEKYQDIFKREGNRDITKCFGTNNEIEHVFNVINEKKLPLDECLIVTTSNDIGYALINYLDYYHIPYTTSIGHPFSHTNVGIFISRLKMMNNMSYGVDAYKMLFNDDFFDKEKYLSPLKDNERYINDFIKYAGWLRLSFDHQVDIDETLYRSEIYESLKLLQEDLSKGIYHFVSNNVKDDGYNLEALQALENYLSLCEKYHLDAFSNIDQLLSSNISNHISSPGCIHICNLNQSFSTIRKHIFVLGLDSSFPGSPKEDYLIYDEEYILMNAEQYTSESLIKEKEEMMNLLLNCCSNSYLSYIYFDNVNLKKINPSSIISSKYDVEDIKEYGYEDNNISSNASLIQKYNKGYISNVVTSHEEFPYNPDVLLYKAYSPSSFGGYYENRLNFILSNIYGISVDESDDPYTLINPNDRGTLFHDLVRNFDKSKIDKKTFLTKGEKAFTNFLKKRPPLIKESAYKEHDSFMNMLDKFYDYEQGNTPVYSEKRLDCKIHDIRFVGSFDRLEKDEYGNYILVDYKTGGTIKHKKEDVISCIQGLLYAYMIESELGIKVDRCEFRYPFVGNKVIKITYDSTNKQSLLDKVDEFKNDISTHIPANEGNSSFTEKYERLISLYREVSRHD